MLENSAAEVQVMDFCGRVFQAKPSATLLNGLLSVVILYIISGGKLDRVQ